MTIKRPIGHNILVEVEDNEKTTASGIILISGEDKQVNPTAIVKMLSKKTSDIELSDGSVLNVGDRIMFERGHDINYISKTECLLNIVSVITKL